jgi:hypothetical protein
VAFTAAEATAAEHAEATKDIDSGLVIAAVVVISVLVIVSFSVFVGTYVTWQRQLRELILSPQGKKPWPFSPQGKKPDTPTSTVGDDDEIVEMMIDTNPSPNLPHLSPLMPFRETIHRKKCGRAVACPKGHPMHAAGANHAGWVCGGITEGCRRGGAGGNDVNGTTRYTCPACNFDLCEWCFWSQVSGLQCPHGHDLGLRLAQDDFFMCDRCSAQVLAGSTLLNCSDCDYDLCTACANDMHGLLTVTPPPGAANCKFDNKQSLDNESIQINDTVQNETSLSNDTGLDGPPEGGLAPVVPEGQSSPEGLAPVPEERSLEVTL